MYCCGKDFIRGGGGGGGGGGGESQGSTQWLAKNNIKNQQEGNEPS